MPDQPEQTTDELIASILEMLRRADHPQDKARMLAEVAEEIQQRLDEFKAGKRTSI